MSVEKVVSWLRQPKTRENIKALAGYLQVILGGMWAAGLTDFAIFKSMSGWMAVGLIVTGAITNQRTTAPKDYKFVDGLNQRRM